MKANGWTLLAQPWIAVSLGLAAGSAQALEFELDYGEGIQGVLNSTITMGAGWRMQDRAPDLLGKANINPDVCAGQQLCQGLFRAQSQPAETLVAAPGAFSSNGDDGNWNYDRHDPIGAPVKITQDLDLTYGDYGLFVRWLYFYDVVNNDFTEFHPNQIFTDANGAPNTNAPYGAGTARRTKRSDPEVLRQVGADLQLRELNVHGEFPLPGDRNLLVRLGRQNINWGESTMLVINSLNQVNPVNANNLFRVGLGLEELFTPVGAVYLATEPFENGTVEAFYQYEWEPLEIPAPGSFYSFFDIGSYNVGDHASAAFGSAAEDPERIGSPVDNPLSGTTNTTTTVLRVPDHEPGGGGQYGIALRYLAEGLNDGTELGFYFMNYHSRLPYVSTWAATASCARREGNPQGIDATDINSFVLACPDIPMFAGAGATDSAAPLDSQRFGLEYPEGIQLYGVSFNTNVGEWGLQGEIAYRPNLPLQVDVEDLFFAGLAPTLTRCHNYTCAGTSSNPDPQYGSSDGSGSAPGAADTFSLGTGHMPGSARSFPSFVTPYRGGVAGENPPSDPNLPYDSSNPGYIRGWERFKVFQYNLGATYLMGASDNPLGADQVIFLGELGATHVPDLPAVDVLQIEAPGTFTHASAGADGSGADGSRLACSTTPSGNPCVLGVDGLRFNPHQEDPRGYSDKFSWGYRAIAVLRYESVLPGISLAPVLIWQHDVHGTAPGPGEPFLEGRKAINALLETRYRDNLSFNVGYNVFTGAGRHNVLRDRDNALVFIKYLF